MHLVKLIIILQRLGGARFVLSEVELMKMITIFKRILPTFDLHLVGERFKIFRGKIQLGSAYYS